MTQKLFYRNKFLMYSRFELFIPLAESDELDSLFKEIVLRAEQLENLISKFIPESETFRVNSGAALKPVKVSSPFIALIEKCISYTTLTKGYFTICKGKQPKKGIGIDINKQMQTVFFNTSRFELDFGAIGKGFAAEQAVELLKSNGIKQALINFGDSSVYGLGTHPHGDYWPVTITNSAKSKTVRLQNKALSSSGLHLADDTPVPHIFNPLTGKMINTNEKVVVISASPVVAEVLSTALYAAPPAARENIKLNFPEEEVFIL